MMAVSAETLPSGADWSYEVKWDGYRAQIVKEGASVALASRNLKNITKPEIVSKWWLPGMHRAGGEPPTLAPGKRVALHHMIVAGDRGYGAWRDGGFTIHDLSDKSKPKLLSHINWSPPYPGGTHTPLPLPGRNLAVVADEANAEKCAKGLFHSFIVDVRAPENPVPISTLPTRDVYLRTAVSRAYEAVGCIGFEGAQYRKDIAARALKK